jgi:phosphoribosylamine--glycine ligase
MFDGQFGDASATVVIEHFLTGIEFSVFALTDGKDYILLPVAKDYKRIGEGDTGLNTGGMGTVSPPSFVDQELMNKVTDRIIKPTIHGLQQRNIDYKGFLFFGLISVAGDPYVIEYNCRMGDPETQVVLPRMQNDLLNCFKAVFDGTLGEHTPLSTDQTCVAIVMASGGYPQAYEKGKVISINEPLEEDEIIFHAGTKKEGDQLKTSGGRVLACCALGPHLSAARDTAYELTKKVDFDKAYFRRDIGLDLMTHV